MCVDSTVQCSTALHSRIRHAAAQHSTAQQAPVTARMVPPATAAAPILRFLAQWRCSAGCASFTSGGCSHQSYDSVTVSVSLVLSCLMSLHEDCGMIVSDVANDFDLSHISTACRAQKKIGVKKKFCCSVCVANQHV